MKLTTPFKFIKEKPPWASLYSTLKRHYTKSIDRFQPEQIQILLFFYLSDGPFIERKADLLNEKDLIHILNKMDLNAPYKGLKYKKYEPYYSYLKIYEPITEIPKKLLITALVTTSQPGKFINFFDNIKLPKAVENIIEKEEGSILDLIDKKDVILTNFTSYISPTSNQEITKIINSKEELAEDIFHYILKGHLSLPYYILTGVSHTT